MTVDEYMSMITDDMLDVLNNFDSKRHDEIIEEVMKLTWDFVKKLKIIRDELKANGELPFYDRSRFYENLRDMVLLIMQEAIYFGEFADVRMTTIWKYDEEEIEKIKEEYLKNKRRISKNRRMSFRV